MNLKIGTLMMAAARMAVGAQADHFGTGDHNKLSNNKTHWGHGTMSSLPPIVPVAAPLLVLLFLKVLPARASLHWIGDTNGGDGTSLYQEANWSDDGDAVAPHSTPPAGTIDGATPVNDDLFIAFGTSPWPTTRKNHQAKLMKTKSKLPSLGIALLLFFSDALILHAQGQIEMVPVGNAGNVDDTTGSPNPAGAVGYEYKIGKYQVTNAQYAEFLNAVAAADANALYNTSMGSDARGGITRSGASPNFTYAVKADMGDKPVNYVSWYDCLRFCNWLHNGQSTGLQDGSTTEGGAYTLTGATNVVVGTDPTHGANGRNTGARFHLPAEDEWYKAAYYEPGATTDDANEYWNYPTRSDDSGDAPIIATADAFGNINNDTGDIANYDTGADWNGQNGNVTTVGSGGPGARAFTGPRIWEGTCGNGIVRSATWRRAE